MNKIKIRLLAMLVVTLVVVPLASAVYPYHMVWVVASDDVDRINLKDAVNQPDYDIRVKVANCGMYTERNITVRIVQSNGHVLFEGINIIPVLDSGMGQVLGITIPIDKFSQCDCSTVDKMGWADEILIVTAYSQDWALEPVLTDNIFTMALKIKPFCHKM